MGKISNQTVVVILVSLVGTCAAFLFQLDRLAYLCMFFGFLALTFDGVSVLFAIYKHTVRTNELLEEISIQLKDK